MGQFNIFHEYAQEIEGRIRLRTFPLAIKLLKSKDEIPENAERPLRDFGYPVLLCQGFAMSRKDGKRIAIFKEDMWCFEPIIGFGWAEPPQYFLEGHNRFPQDVDNLEAGKNYVNDFPCFEVGKYQGVVSAPLTTVNFEPDVVILYCNSEQLSLLLLAKEYKNGHDLKCSLSSHAACVYSVVPAIKTGECQVAIPCRGDRSFALAGENEVIFSVPKHRLEDLINGLRYIEQYDSRLPKSPAMSQKPERIESYAIISKMLGCS